MTGLCGAEVGAVGGALGAGQQAVRPLTLVSVKSVYGHTEGAAGDLLASGNHC